MGSCHSSSQHHLLNSSKPLTIKAFRKSKSGKFTLNNSFKECKKSSPPAVIRQVREEPYSLSSASSLSSNNAYDNFSLNRSRRVEKEKRSPVRSSAVVIEVPIAIDKSSDKSSGESNSTGSGTESEISNSSSSNSSNSSNSDCSKLSHSNENSASNILAFSPKCEHLPLIEIDIDLEQYDNAASLSQTSDKPISSSQTINNQSYSNRPAIATRLSPFPIISVNKLELIESSCGYVKSTHNVMTSVSARSSVNMVSNNLTHTATTTTISTTTASMSNGVATIPVPVPALAGNTSNVNKSNMNADSSDLNNNLSVYVNGHPAVTNQSSSVSSISSSIPGSSSTTTSTTSVLTSVNPTLTVTTANGQSLVNSNSQLPNTSLINRFGFKPPNPSHISSIQAIKPISLATSSSGPSQAQVNQTNVIKPITQQAKIEIKSLEATENNQKQIQKEKQDQSSQQHLQQPLMTKRNPSPFRSFLKPPNAISLGSKQQTITTSTIPVQSTQLQQQQQQQLPPSSISPNKLAKQNQSSSLSSLSSTSSNQSNVNKSVDKEISSLSFKSNNNQTNLKAGSNVHESKKNTVNSSQRPHITSTNENSTSNSLKKAQINVNRAASVDKVNHHLHQQQQQSSSQVQQQQYQQQQQQQQAIQSQNSPVQQQSGIQTVNQLHKKRLFSPYSLNINSSKIAVPSSQAKLTTSISPTSSTKQQQQQHTNSTDLIANKDATNLNNESKFTANLKQTSGANSGNLKYSSRMPTKSELRMPQGSTQPPVYSLMGSANLNKSAVLLANKNSEAHVIIQNESEIKKNELLTSTSSQEVDFNRFGLTQIEPKTGDMVASENNTINNIVKLSNKGDILKKKLSVEESKASAAQMAKKLGSYIKSLSIEENENENQVFNEANTNANDVPNNPAVNKISFKSNKSNIQDSIGELTNLINDELYNSSTTQGTKQRRASSTSSANNILANGLIQPMFKPPSSLPPIENSEVISIDIDTFRLIMQDLQNTKTILYKLAHLLKEPSTSFGNSNSNENSMCEFQPDDIQNMIISNPLVSSLYNQNVSCLFYFFLKNQF
jgi:hypothetical protein